jgi:hypothetical protein
MSAEAMHVLLAENAQRRAELAELKASVAQESTPAPASASISTLKSASSQDSKSLPASQPPSSPKVARKFPHIRDPAGSARAKNHVSEKVRAEDCSDRVNKIGQVLFCCVHRLYDALMPFSLTRKAVPCKCFTLNRFHGLKGFEIPLHHSYLQRPEFILLFS